MVVQRYAADVTEKSETLQRDPVRNNLVMIPQPQWKVSTPEQRESAFAALVDGDA
jgi:hypothetical protein